MNNKIKKSLNILVTLLLVVSFFTLTGCKNNTDEKIDNKIVLKLQNYRDNPISLNFEKEDLVKSKVININHKQLTENVDNLYNYEEELNDLVKYIKDTLHIEINNRWRVHVNYYTDDKSSGMVEFIYTIGEINTNRSIIFNINENKYDIVYYKCLTDEINENELSNRVEKFKNKYIQEKRDLQSGEEFYDEMTNYIYYINADVLIYSYQYFFKYGSFDVINNDFGTECIIDENGNAQKLV